MGPIETGLSALGLKKALAGLLGGAISGAILPGPLAVLNALWKRAGAGAACGALIAYYGAGPLATMLERPDDAQGIAFGLGLAGLSIAFKLINTWNDFDLGGLARQLFNGNGKGGNS